MKNNNKKIIRKLSRSSLKNNRMRNIFAIMAIALTSLLFTSLFTLVSGQIQVTEEQTMRRIGTKAHGGFKAVTKKEYEKLVDHPLVKDYGYDISIGMASNKELKKRQTEIRYIQPHKLKFGFVKIKEGKLPEKENEIVLDTIALNLLEVPHEIGQEVTLQFNFLGKEYHKKFILSGWYEGDPVMGASTVFVSKLFVDELKKGMTDDKIRELNKDLPGQQDNGLYQVDIMFKNSFHIEKNMMKVINDSGLKLDQRQIGINWAYLSQKASDMDLASTIILAFIFIVILLTGFLIIFNIFHISILNDIRFYGLLKTIGTTKKQIKFMVIRQALLLSLIGIPIGLLSGFLVGKVIMPLILNMSSGLGSTGFSIKANPYIFLFGGVFSLLTVLISCRKPSKIAGSVSPVEALRYSDHSKIKGKNNKSTNGAKISKMALSNLARNKKKTIVVVVSLSLSVVLLTEIITLTKSFSLNSYLESMLTGDAMIFSSDMVNHGSDLKLSDEFYKSALQQSGVLRGSALYHNKSIIKHTLTKKGHKQFVEFDKDGRLDKRDPEIGITITENKPIEEQRYAYDEALLKNLKVIDGTFDLEKFNTGNYVLLTPRIDFTDTYYQPGDKITLNFTGSNPEYKNIKDSKGNIIDSEIIYTKQKQYEVMAIVDLPTCMTEKRFALNGLTTILPKDELLKMDGLTEMFGASFIVEDGKETAFSKFLEAYTTKIDPNTAYQTKESLRGEFASMTNNIALIGKSLAFVIAIIGILNFINTMFTSVITRKREFAMLQSIGLTNYQLMKLLLFEGIYYIAFTTVISIVLGSILSLTVVRAFNNIANYFTYQFTVLPFIETIPIFILIAFGVPLIAYGYLRKYSIVERMRED